MRLDLRKLRFRQPKLVATHLCLLFGSRESSHYARANTFMGPDPKGQSLSQERFEEAHKAGSIFDWDPKNRHTVSSIRKSRKSRSRRVHSGGTKGKGSCRQYGRKAGGAL